MTPRPNDTGPHATGPTGPGGTAPPNTASPRTTHGDTEAQSDLGGPHREVRGPTTKPHGDLRGPRLSPTVRAHLADARECLAEAAAARTPAARYISAHLAALRAAAAVLAARPRPMDGRRRRLRSAWELLPEADPRLAEWAAYFAVSAAKRAAAEAGMARVVSARDAEELLGEAEIFVGTIESLLGVPGQHILPGTVPLAG